MEKFNVNRIVLCTHSEGPYNRLSIWFQGCNIGCPECCNADLQPLVAKNILSLNQIVDVICNSKKKYDIEGVTYLGGEPTLQTGLPALSSSIKEMGLGLIAFTGRRYEDVADILNGCDLVVDGPYIARLGSHKRRIIGSDNQRIIHLTTRYENNGWFLNSGRIYGEFSVTEDDICYCGSRL